MACSNRKEEPKEQKEKTCQHLIELMREIRFGWIEGLAIRGENASNQTLTGLEGVIKTDSGEEIRLRVSTEGSQGKQIDARDVPAGSKFTLESVFQPDGAREQVGIPAEDFLSNYGGLILRVNCTLGSVQTTLIEYFSTSQLRAQLADAS